MNNTMQVQVRMKAPDVEILEWLMKQTERDEKSATLRWAMRTIAKQMGYAPVKQKKRPDPKI